ncbi:MAG: flagellar hook-basal body protein [Anaerolineaceae bacterium]
MLKGIYSAASAMIVGLNRQTVISHNIDNLETPGFKEIMVSMDDFVDTVVSEKSLLNGSSASQPFLQNQGINKLRRIGDLGLGVMTSPQTTNYDQGALQITNEPLDLAIEGAGFFRVQTPDGIRYTRDGRFIRDASGTLVTVDGYQVLGKNGAAIKLGEGDISIKSDGTISVAEKASGQIDLVAFKDPDAELTRDLPNTFVAAGAPTSTEVGRMEQGALEATNVDTARLMTQMISTTRAYEAAQQLLKVQDDLLGKSIAALGNF